jgi:asparagine synthase (glutamine-hydrolysing)
MPSEIARRYWKGGISRHSKSLLPENLAFYRELLLDGALVKHGLLDRRRVEDALSGEPSKSTVHTTEVTDYVCIEAWLGCFTMSQPESQQELLHSHAVA